MPVTSHDVAELNASRLAVPETDAKQHEKEGAEDNGQGNDQIAIFDVVVLFAGGLGALVQNEGKGDGGLVLVTGALLVHEQGDGDVVRARALEVLLLDVEGDDAPGGGNAVCFVQLLEVVVIPVLERVVAGRLLVAGAVEVVHAHRDLNGGVGGDVIVVGAVEEVRVPSDVVNRAIVQSRAGRRVTQGRVLAIEVVAPGKGTLGVLVGRTGRGRITRRRRNLAVPRVREEAGRQIVWRAIDDGRRTVDLGVGGSVGFGRAALVVDFDPGVGWTGTALEEVGQQRRLGDLGRGGLRVSWEGGRSRHEDVEAS